MVWKVMACQCMVCKAIRALIIGGFAIVLVWLAWKDINMFMSFLFAVFLLIFFIFILFYLGRVLLLLLATTRSNPNSTITTLIIGGLGIDVGWWAWNVIKMFIIVVGWLVWGARFFLIFLCVVFVIIIAVFLLICFISILFSLPPPTPNDPILTITITKSTWSTEEGYEATAAAFSVITGVDIISEKDVQKHIEQGKKVTALDIKDVFYGRLSSSKTKVNDQEQIYYIPDSAYDPQHDYDFTNYEGDDDSCTRGGYSYKRPAGWNRKAVQVIGKYKDDVWLGRKGWRDAFSPGEWAVSYHGTKIQYVSSIVAGGYDTKKYGRGIYSTPDIKVAEDYATDFNYKGEKCKCILQNRVNLKKTKEHKTPNGIYFVTPDEDDIRPYGVCIKKI